jgi:hypothetical protein
MTLVLSTISLTLSQPFLLVRFAKLITKELGFEGELNDVRPAGSPPLEWYFQMGAR